MYVSSAVSSLDSYGLFFNNVNLRDKLNKIHVYIPSIIVKNILNEKNRLRLK